MNNTQKLDDIRRRIRHIETRLGVDRFGRGEDQTLSAVPVLGAPALPGAARGICGNMQSFVHRSVRFRNSPVFGTKRLFSLARWCSPRTIAAIVLVCQSLRFSRWPLQ